VYGTEGGEIHHIKYRSQGGEHFADNLILLSKKAHYEEHSVQPRDPKIYKKAIKRNMKRLKGRL
jgi:5-methylcytosine-specific restriction endonuclease McrA